MQWREKTVQSGKSWKPPAIIWIPQKALIFGYGIPVKLKMRYLVLR